MSLVKNAVKISAWCTCHSSDKNFSTSKSTLSQGKTEAKVSRQPNLFLWKKCFSASRTLQREPCRWSSSLRLKNHLIWYRWFPRRQVGFRTCSVVTYGLERFLNYQHPVHSIPAFHGFFRSQWRIYRNLCVVFKAFAGSRLSRGPP